jgi:hypothetical protein
MRSRLLLRVTAPAVAIGLVLFAACLASICYIHRLQTSLAEALDENVASLRAAQELEIRVRQLRFHNLLYLTDPRPDRLSAISAGTARVAGPGQQPPQWLFLRRGGGPPSGEKGGGSLRCAGATPAGALA